ncbi:nucleoside phosphorylase domain-containing protein [Trichoderma pleuroticola]
MLTAVDATARRRWRRLGWIYAIRTEYIAISPNNNNAYTLGKIEKYNIVIAVLPNGQYSISSAAGVARDIIHSFPNIKVSLIVGIRGGAPSKKHNIRLGNIMVSAPQDGRGGVFHFRLTGFLNQPPAVLLTAVTVISSQYKSDSHSLKEEIINILRKKLRLQKKYSRPDLSISCGTNLSKLVLRSKRTQDKDNLAIHYGVIASGNQLIKDASIRDKLAAEEDILCFEMEAAGLINHFPCLVICSICNYSNSHKNKEVKAKKKFGNILSNLAIERLSKDKQNRDAIYKWYKDRVEERLNQESGPLLVSADPGCGKSKPSLIKHAMQQFRKDRQGLINSTESLWEVLRNAIKDPQAGPVIIVLNTLDKCAESEFADLMQHIESHFRNNQSSHGKLKYLLTCRPQEVNRVIIRRKEDFKKTLKGIESTITTVPRSTKEDPMVRKVLSIILAASRPLTLSEINITVNIDYTSQSIHDLDLEEEEDFKTPYAVLTELCVLYLNLFNSDVKLPISVNGEAGHPVSSHAFASIINNTDIIPSAAKICNLGSKSYSIWFRIYWGTTGIATTEHFTDLIVASHFRHNAVVKELLKNGAEVKAKDKANVAYK